MSTTSNQLETCITDTCRKFDKKYKVYEKSRILVLELLEAGINIKGSNSITLQDLVEM